MGLLQVASLSFGTFAAVSCEMLEKRGNEGVNGENRKRPTNDVESEPNTQDTSTTSDTNNSTQNS